MNIHKLFDTYFLNKKILILGFGKEGKAAYYFIRKHYSDCYLGVSDSKKADLPEYDSFTKLYSGEDYLNCLIEYDIVLKSPGISLPAEFRFNNSFFLTSQTEIFLNIFSKQIIGITGTKGKSTTASLLYHLLKTAGRQTLLGGNIGKPVFELVEEITPETIIVLELSSHQLQYIKTSPKIAILLNIYPEHLDYYKTYDDYKNAKMNITSYQFADNCLIYPLTEFLNINTEAEKISFLISDLKEKSATIRYKLQNDWQEFTLDRTMIKIPGEHNLYNIVSAMLAAILSGCVIDEFISGVYTFLGLKHRLQEVIEINKIHFINDSISTIPETTIAALKVYNHCVESIILGGFSRGDGISFKKLAEELLISEIDNIFLLPETGKKIYQELLIAGAESIDQESEFVKIIYNGKSFRCFFVKDFTTIIKLVFKYSKRHKKNKICLLSPASTSYNSFKNFEERGDTFIAAIATYTSELK